VIRTIVWRNLDTGADPTAAAAAMRRRPRSSMGSYSCGQFLAEPPEWLWLVLPEDEPLDFVVLVDVVLVVPPLAALAIAAPPPASKPSTETVATASRSLSRVILYLLSVGVIAPSQGEDTP
jgi:hypothetical protein